MRKNSSTSGNPVRNRKTAGALGQLLAYAGVIAIYFVSVLHFLGRWLKPLFERHRPAYAFVSLALMVVQGFLLEMLTTALFGIVRRKKK